ncbi:MAG: MoaD/ThiS family protein [Candidatus Verstraetearchaeota archaeon]|nr:MoaD/ThiS family protein [Candidatus Verstraetearchaeota archaeon]
MRVKVSYLSILRDATGVKEEELQMEEGATVEDLIHRLIEKYGDRMKRLLTDSEIEQGIMITLDGVLLSKADMKNPISDGSEVLIGLPPFGG